MATLELVISSTDYLYLDVGSGLLNVIGGHRWPCGVNSGHLWPFILSGQS